MKAHNSINDNGDDDFRWAFNFSERMAEFGERMAKLGEKMADSSDVAFNNCSIRSDSCDTQMVTINGKTTIKKGNTKITIDKEGNVTINGKKVEKEDEKKPKHGDLEKLPDIPNIDDPDLFMNISTKVCDNENLTTTPLTIAHLNKYELELEKLESKLRGKIEKLLVAVLIIGLFTLTTLVFVCLSL